MVSESNDNLNRAGERQKTSSPTGNPAPLPNSSRTVNSAPTGNPTQSTATSKRITVQSSAVQQSSATVQQSSATPLVKRMMWRVAKLALKQVPIIGPAYSMIDEVVLRSIKETRQEEVNKEVDKLVQFLNEKLVPIIARLGKGEIADEELPDRLEQPDIKPMLEVLRKEFAARQNDFIGITQALSEQVSRHEAQIKELTDSVAQIYQSLEMGRLFKHIAQSVQTRIALQGQVSDLYDKMQLLPATGGQGEIYRAHRKGMPANKTAIVKVLKEKRSANSMMIKRFLLEGFLSSQIRHPNIVSVYEYGGFWNTNEYFIEMEDLGETNWRQWSAQNPCTEKNLERYLDLLLQALTALSAIHQENLVHRDVKPSNFMIKDDRLVLIDFGSVKSLEAEESLRQGRTLTMTGSNETVGTPQYMSPEQFDKSKGKVSPASDVYGLGVTLFELLTGQLPFVYSHGTFLDYARAHCEIYPVYVSEYNKEIPGWLVSLVSSMLKKKPSERDSIATIRLTIEQNRQNTITVAMGEAQKLLKDLLHGLNEETEQSIRKIMEQLKNCLVGVESAKEDLTNFLARTESRIQELKDISQQEEVLKLVQFDPYRCPNMMCDALLQTGKETCPQCKTSWLMPCVCEKKKETSYIRDKCQRCKEYRAIPLIAKQKYAVEVTLQRCLAEKKYADIIRYCKAFASMVTSEPTLNKIYEDTKKKIRDQNQANQSRIVEQVKEEYTGVLKKNEKAIAREDEKRREQVEQEQAWHIEKMEKMIQIKEYNIALEYYETSLPQHLKNERTKTVRDEICNALNADEISQANDLMAKHRFDEAMSILENIPPQYQTQTIEQMKIKIQTAQAEKRRAKIKRLAVVLLILLSVAIGLGWMWAEEAELAKIAKLYELPVEVWKECSYEYKGTQYLDMATEYWANLGWQKQSEYARAYQRGYAKAKGLALEKTITLPNLPSNAKPLKMILIPPGRFWQGSPDNESGRWGVEGPRHKVLIPFAYYLSEYECTQAQWQAVMGNNPSYLKNAGPDAPVENVSWNDIANGSSSFCGKTGLLLPTESMWEYACRAGVTDTRYEPNLSNIAWYHENSGSTSHPVGEKHPNAYGLYDMLGNVWEWCADTYIAYQSQDIVAQRLTSIASITSAVNRGGSWYNHARHTRCANRNFYSADNRYDYLGFRLSSLP